VSSYEAYLEEQEDIGRDGQNKMISTSMRKTARSYNFDTEKQGKKHKWIRSKETRKEHPPRN